MEIVTEEQRWAKEKEEESRFQEEYKKNVEDCAEEIIQIFKDNNNDYVMQYFVGDVMGKVRAELKKIGVWED